MFSLATKSLAGLSVMSLVLALVTTSVSPDRVAVTLFFCVFGAAMLMTFGVRATTGYNDRAAVLGVSGSANRPAAKSFAPVLVALGGGAIVVGAAVGVVAYVAGLVLVAAGAAFWIIDTWREHPSSTPRISTRVSNSFSLPFLMPLIVLGLIGFAAVSFSRIFLSFSESSSWIVASAIAVALFLGSFVVALLPKQSSRRTFGIFLVALMIAIGAVGLIGLLRGPVEHEEGHSEGVEKVSEGVEKTVEGEVVKEG